MAEHRTGVAVAAMLEEITGYLVQERCEQGEDPRCRFQIEAAR
jgi:hypothetical protein